MSQFDVHRNRGHQSVIPYVVILQSRRFDPSGKRVVAPLVLRAAAPPTIEPQLNPVFEIEGQDVVLDPLQVASVGIDRLGPHVGSLKGGGHRIIAAIDRLITRAWDA